MTPDEIMEASEAGDPVIWTAKQVRRVLDMHEGEPPEDFYREHPAAIGQPYDAGKVLAWLGY